MTSTFMRPALAFLAFCILAGSSFAEGVQFQGLGTLSVSAGGSVGRDISADGSVVVGGSPEAGTLQEAWRWTSAGGLQGLGFPLGQTTSSAHVISAGGQFVAGTSGLDAFRWSAGGGFDAIAVGQQRLRIAGISDDGTTIVGSGDQYPVTAETLAWRWRHGIGIDLSIPGNFIQTGYTNFTGLSGDGETILGVEGFFDDSTPFLLTDSGRTNLWIDVAKFHCQCGDSASAMTPDASFVVGDFEWTEAYRWNVAAEQEQLLGFVDFGTTDLGSHAADISDSGRVIVGYASGHPPEVQTPFLWRAKTGMLDLRALLVANGIDLTGWQLNSATAVSADGTFILGNGINPSGDPEAWLAEVPASVFALPVLAPPALAILVCLFILAGALAFPTLNGPHIEPRSEH